MEAFITGSQAYGIPRPNSDIDVCALVTDAELEKLDELADPEPERDEEKYPRGAGERRRSLRFGRLNLICPPSPAAFLAWRAATSELMHRKPVTRAEACKTIKERLSVLD